MSVEYDKHDRYGRIVGKVLLNGTDTNIEQVRAGLAWWYRDYAKEQVREDRGRYAIVEQQAQAQRVGLWRDVNPVPPWNWRKAKRHGGD